MKKKKIYLFTEFFPYGNISESFLQKELETASTMADITLVPLYNDKGSRPVPEGVRIDESLSRTSLLKKTVIVMKTFFGKELWKSYLKDKKRIGLIRYIWFTYKYSFRAELVCSYFDGKEKEIPKDAVLYSYWFSYFALGLAFARKRNRFLENCVFISRAHGYDVYEEKRNTFFPHREFTIQSFDFIYPVSQAGLEFMTRRYPLYIGKFAVRYLGTAAIERKSEPNTHQEIKFLSCSSMSKVKRVGLIYRMVCAYAKANPSQKCVWTHIGGGIDTDLVGQWGAVPENLDIDLKGQMPNKDIHALYSERNFDIFVNLSLSEGLPVSIMEAISAGIPVLATDVGGEKEIIDGRNGVLVPVNLGVEDFTSAADKILANWDNMSKHCVEVFRQRFDAQKNYQDFYL
ncbi:MAG: glycosyltransferase [Bacteroidales bacterium]|nr:glycosyltransferase [Bacteroidales bacterium]